MPEPTLPPADEKATDTDIAVRRHMARLRALAARLDHQAALIRHGGFNPRAEAQAGRLADDAHAVRWVLCQIAPERECIGQMFEALHGAGPS